MPGCIYLALRNGNKGWQVDACICFVQASKYPETYATATPATQAQLGGGPAQSRRDSFATAPIAGGSGGGRPSTGTSSGGYAESFLTAPAAGRSVAPSAAGGGYAESFATAPMAGQSVAPTLGGNYAESFATAAQVAPSQVSIYAEFCCLVRDVHLLICTVRPTSATQEIGLVHTLHES